MSQLDIRIGTLAGMDKGAAYLKQILPHGFESFSLTCWEFIGKVDLKKTATEVLETIDGKAVISCIGLFGNPLQNAQTAKDWIKIIDAAPLFKTDLVCGFTGAIEGKPLPESMKQFKKVWEPLVKRAKDKGLRIGILSLGFSVEKADKS